MLDARPPVSFLLATALWLAVVATAGAEAGVPSSSHFPLGPVSPARAAQLETIRKDPAYCQAEVDQLTRVGDTEYARLHAGPQQARAIFGDEHMSDQRLKTLIAKYDEVFKNFSQPILFDMRKSCSKKPANPEVAALKDAGPLLGIKPEEMTTDEYRLFVLNEVDFRNGHLKPPSP